VKSPESSKPVEKETRHGGRRLYERIQELQRTGGAKQEDVDKMRNRKSPE
jgi:hypothetical protein